MLDKVTSSIPNTITSLNLVSGCVAIFMAFQYDAVMGGLTGAQWAMIAIGAAAVFDFGDGASARALKRYSPLGKDLDSLSDLVSFGVAPAMLIANMMLSAGASLWQLIPLAWIPVAGAMRLAKFNNDTTQSTVFRGLPIPANAIFWIGVNGWSATYGYPGWIAVWILTALMAEAMMANFKMFSLKFKSLDFHENFIRYVLIAAAILFVVLYGISGLAWTVVLYLLLSILRQRRI